MKFRNHLSIFPKFTGLVVLKIQAVSKVAHKPHIKKILKKFPENFFMEEKFQMPYFQYILGWSFRIQP
jgi:hypothetical protein